MVIGACSAHDVDGAALISIRRLFSPPFFDILKSDGVYELKAKSIMKGQIYDWSMRCFNILVGMGGAMCTLLSLELGS